MRIYGNRQLKTLPGKNTRPTSSRVRTALFNIWQNKIINSSFLDLCAGNGSIGAEALCRNANNIVGIEKSDPACKVIQENWQKVAKDNGQFKIIKGDIKVKIFSLKDCKFDLIYFDPPYASEFYNVILQSIASLDLLNDFGEIAVEYNEKFWQPIAIDDYEICRLKNYGNTSLVFYQKFN